MSICKPDEASAIPEEGGMWIITHIVFCSLHFIPGHNGGWVKSKDVPRFATEERIEVELPLEGYWEKVS